MKGNALVLLGVLFLGSGASYQSASEAGLQSLARAIRSRDYGTVTKWLNGGRDANVVLGKEAREPLQLSPTSGPTFWDSYAPLHAIGLPASRSRQKRGTYSTEQLLITADFLRRGASLAQRTQGGESPLDIALSHRQDELARFYLLLGRANNEEPGKALSLLDCAPRMPRTLDLFLACESGAPGPGETRLVYRACLEAEDWESMLVLVRRLGSASVPEAVRLTIFQGASRNRESEQLAVLASLIRKASRGD